MSGEKGAIRRGAGKRLLSKPAEKIMGQLRELVDDTLQRLDENSALIIDHVAKLVGFRPLPDEAQNREKAHLLFMLTPILGTRLIFTFVGEVKC